MLTDAAIGTAVLAVKLWLLIWKQQKILDLMNRICVFSIQNDDDHNCFNEKLKGFIKFALVFVIAATVVGSIESVVLSLYGNEKTLFLKIGFPLDYENSEVAFYIATAFLFTGVILSIIAIIFSIVIWYLLVFVS